MGINRGITARNNFYTPLLHFTTFAIATA